MANVKAIYLDSNGVYRPAGSGDTLDVGDIKLLNQTTADGVLSTNAQGVVSSAKLADANVAANAAIAGSKIDPDFGAQNIETTGSVTAASFSGNLTGNSNGVHTGNVTGDVTGNVTGNLTGNVTGNVTGNLTGAVTGNASTASAWQNSRTVSFAGGDVTGSFSIDGSANVSSVDLTIEASSVTNSMLAGSIADSKLLTISTPGKVSDAALSANVALLDRNSQTFSGTTPAFSNPLSVGAPTLNAHAATKLYVDDAVAAAEAGIDYKQEAQWFWDMAQNTQAFSEPNTKAGFLAAMNGQVSIFTAGDRILLNNSAAAAADVGIYVFGGASPNYTLARASDMANGSDATGAWVYCLQTIDQNGGAAALNQAYVCSTPSATTNTTPIQFVLYAAGQTYTASSPLVMTGTNVSLTIGNGLANSSNALVASAAANGAINVSGAGIAAVVDDSTIQIASNAIAFKSLPSQFKINGDSTSAAVSADNLDILVAGVHSSADSLHAHSSIEKAFARSGAAISDGLAVSFDGSTVAKASKSAGAVVGVVTQDLGSSACYVATSGVVKITNLFGGPSAGSNVYLYTDGRLCGYSNLSANDYVTKVGRYLGAIGPSGADMIVIEVQEFGIKP